jgi:hypothetical protein
MNWSELVCCLELLMVICLLSPSMLLQPTLLLLVICLLSPSMLLEPELLLMQQLELSVSVI